MQKNNLNSMPLKVILHKERKARIALKHNLLVAINKELKKFNSSSNVSNIKDINDLSQAYANIK